MNGFHRGGQAEPQAGDPITPRELEVIYHVAAGETNQEIGAQIGTATKTVKSHLCHIYTKLCVRNRAGLVAQAIAGGLIEIEAYRV